MQSDEWLTFGGSLTEKMEQAAGQPIQVKVLSQGIAPVFQDERTQLSILPRQWGWVREVELSFAGVPWVLARTIVPQYALKGSLKRLTLLGDTPLGPLLFNRLSAKRHTIDFERIVSAGWCQRHSQTHLWCRNSLFYIGRRPLLLKELFLPDHPVYGNE